MAGRILIALSLIAFVSASDIQEQIKQLQVDIKAIQKDLAEETDFLRNTQEKVDLLEQLIEEAISDRNEASKKSFIIYIQVCCFKILSCLIICLFLCDCLTFCLVSISLLFVLLS